MDEQCMVICGDWICRDDSKWEFVIDKTHMCRVVTISAEMNLEELKIACRHEFVKEENEIDVLGLSYWISNNGELVTGIRTPPVLLTNDASIRFFIKQLRVNGSMNLFVRLGKSTIRGNDIVRFSGTFTTPQTQIKERTFLHGDTSGSKELICSSVTSKSKPLDVVDCGSVLTPLEFDDFDLITAAELVESRVSSETTNAAEECGSGWDSFEEDVEGEHDRALIEDVEPRGYDTEFWEPFLESAYGGSNAAEIMLSDTEEKDETPRLKFQRRDVSDVEFMSGNKAAEVNEKVNCLIGHDVPVWVDGRIPKNCSTPRSLESVDDEEFDLEPMFDDMQYVPSDIPDLDIDERDEEVYVGKTFNSKKDCQISLAIYAIKNRFHFKQTRTKLNYFVLSCADERCDWRILAREIPDVGYYEIRKAKLDHICDIDTRNGYKRKASSQIIASVYKAKFGSGSGGPRAMDLQQMILEDLRVNVSYMKCYRAKEIAMYNIRGSEDESYVKLPEYCHMLKLANPGTVADIETEVDEAGNYRFKYMFLAFGASIHGFRRTRLVLVVDGTYLTGRYKGVLLTASGQDANFQVYPLAFAVVDSENDASWLWFFKKLETIVADNFRLTIISDRQTSIYKAKKIVFPKSHHGACVVHLARNVNSRFQKKGLAKLVTRVAYSFKVGSYREEYNRIKSVSISCAKYLDKIGVAPWTRAYFQGDRYNIMTSNIVEQLNHALKKGRGSPIIELMRFIQAMMTRWFCDRRKKVLAHRGVVTPEVDKEMSKCMLLFKGSKVCQISNWVCQVTGVYGGSHTVDLRDKKCSCKLYDKFKIPCGHALIAADSLGVTYGSLAADWFKLSSWLVEYEMLISPEGDAKDVDLPKEVTDLILRPPKTRRTSGRPRESRIPSTGDVPVVRKTKLVLSRCGRCHLEGHNRSTCKNPI